MNRTFTSDYLNKYDLDGRKDNSLEFLQPQKKTIIFLMQFARSYHEEPRLSKQISGMILN
jgi:hypothetical protein